MIGERGGSRLAGKSLGVERAQLQKLRFARYARERPRARRRRRDRALSVFISRLRTTRVVCARSKAV